MEKIKIEERKDYFFIMEFGYSEEEIVYVEITKDVHGEWKWEYLMWIIKEWFIFDLSNQILKPHYPDNIYSREMIDKATNGIIEIIRYLKNHPSYRLRIMNLLDGQIKEIWDLV